MEFTEKRRCVIVAAGKIDNTDILKKNIFYDDFVIAADAGYLKLKAAGIEPDLIVGDFDSSDTPENSVETIILSPVKDCTDTQYAVSQAVERGYGDILVLGGLGGRIDHSLANFAVIGEYKQKNVNICLIDAHHKIYALKNETAVLTKSDRYVSVFSFTDSSVVTLEGFYYSVNGLKLSCFDSIGVSNEITDDTAKITVSEGTVLVTECDKNSF